MGGKSYYCDYCDCFMKNDINVRKAHNVGMLHNIAKANYLQRYKEPQDILAEERNKIPCKRFFNNKECQFGFFCRYSHYSSDELAYLEWLAFKIQLDKENKKSTNKTLPSKLAKRFKNLHLLPPSMQPYDYDKIDDSYLNNQWG